MSEPVVTRTGALRSDVRRNRSALLQAARELFAAASDDVPMYEVARRAGVGQATLYRHFPDRNTLAAALAQELLDDLEAYADQVGDSPDAFHRLLERVIQTSVRSISITKLIYTRSGDEPHLAALQAQLKRMFTKPLAAAKAGGAVRADIDVADVLLIIRMVQGALDMTAPEPAQRAAVGSRALTLITTGTDAVGSRPRRREPTAANRHPKLKER